MSDYPEKVFIKPGRAWGDYAIIGSRDMPSEHFPKITRLIRNLCIARTPKRLISGGGTGVDAVVRHVSDVYGIELVEIPVDYAAHGRSAIVVQLNRIVDACTHLVAIWDLKSKGTPYAVLRAESESKETGLAYFEDGVIKAAKFPKKFVKERKT